MPQTGNRRIMDSISIFEIFKIGVGPSSSHTLGPWNAARMFIKSLPVHGLSRIEVHLFGSLSRTGKGHATDKAVIFGLMDYDPVTIDIQKLDEILDDARDTGQISVNGNEIFFDFDRDILFENAMHPLHPNTLVFKAFSIGLLIKEETYASTGGGFIHAVAKDGPLKIPRILPNPIIEGIDLLRYTRTHQCRISDVVLQNELSIQSEEEIYKQIDKLYQTMLEAIFEGSQTDGILPGGLNVSRRAKKLSDKLLNGAEYKSKEEWLEAIKTTTRDFTTVNKWISCFALAVNEQNAAMGRVVTSPTNGAAGVIPAVLLYYVLFCDFKGVEDIRRFFLTAGEIGCIFVKGATISAAVGGCQAEIGVSSAMAAGALAEMLGGTPEQCLMAAEIAMEHHLGLTCDPIKGLVQVPCIERNTMGAMKAITAANLALESDASQAIVNLDTVIKTMWEVSKDMNHKYKETSEGGLAILLPVVNPYC